MYPSNHIHTNYPEAHWTYHILGYLMDALVSESVNFSIVLRSLVYRTLINDKYNALVNSKQIEPLETIDVTYKLLYWNESANYAAMKEDRVLVCKTMYICDILASKFYENERSI
jgi:hypothetical protein